MRCLHLLILMDAVLKWAHIRLTSLITNTEHTLFTLNWPFANLKAPLKDSTSSLNNFASCQNWHAMIFPVKTSISFTVMCDANLEMLECFIVLGNSLKMFHLL